MRQTGEEERIGYLRDLIAIHTENPPGNEKRAAEYVSDQLKKYAIPSEIQMVEKDRANVVAFAGKRDGRKVILTGHLDVVPPGEGWATDPWQLTFAKNVCHGRGVSDMKSGLAAMMSAFIQVKLQDTLKNTCLILAFTCDEEINGKGTRKFLETYRPEPDTRVIIGEPTSMEIQIAHRGVIRLKLEALGRQAHSAAPKDGSNAICALSCLIAGVEEYHRQRQKIHVDLLPPPTASCTMIRGGIKDNVIPAAAECIIDCRTIPGDSPEKLTGELKRILDRIRLPEGASYQLSPILEMPPGMTDKKCRTVALAEEAYENIMGTAPRVKDFPACSDMPQFTGLGLETILWGPGDIREAHKTNESLKLYELHKMALLYRQFILISDREDG